MKKILLFGVCLIVLISFIGKCSDCPRSLTYSAAHWCYDCKRYNFLKN